jgi:hypothetical protein
MVFVKLLTHLGYLVWWRAFELFLVFLAGEAFELFLARLWFLVGMTAFELLRGC